MIGINMACGKLCFVWSLSLFPLGTNKLSFADRPWFENSWSSGSPCPVLLDAPEKEEKEEGKKAHVSLFILFPPPSLALSPPSCWIMPLLWIAQTGLKISKPVCGAEGQMNSSRRPAPQENKALGTRPTVKSMCWAKQQASPYVRLCHKDSSTHLAWQTGLRETINLAHFIKINRWPPNLSPPYAADATLQFNGAQVFLPIPHAHRHRWKESKLERGWHGLIANSVGWWQP